VGGCATVAFIILFTVVGVGVAIAIAQMGGDADTVGPVAVGVGLFGGMVLGALVGVGVGRLLRGLLTRR
jgi:hypothetical protein